MVPENQWEGKETIEKRATTKKESIEEIVNIFAETEIESFMLHSLSSNNVKGQNEKAINQ